jgi:hypothetical protein
MLRILQARKNKPVEIVTAGANFITGAVVTRDFTDGTIDAAASGYGDYFVDAPKDYTGIYSVVNPNDRDSQLIPEGAKCVVIPTFIGERYATSEATPGYADIGDPLSASNGDLVRTSSQGAYNWVYGGTYEDPHGTLYIVEKVAESTAPATRTMTYNANGGTGTMTDPRSPYYAGKTVVVLPCAFTAPPYKDFVNWNTAAGGTGTDYDPGDDITVGSSNITLYAIYANTHTKLVLDANGGTGTMTDNSKYYEDEVIVVPDCTFAPPSGKKFSKWNTSSAGSGTDYAPDDEITVTSAMIGAATTLYAIWVNA